MAEHSGTLYVAAGGGGDALAACMVARAHDDARPDIATFAWERKLFDPLPGPRRPSEFASLHRAGALNHRIDAHSHLRRRGSRTFLPDLAQSTEARLYLMDPTAGAEGVRGQVAELAALRRSKRIVVVDVGGDILAQGDEPGLRSPLADALVLAGVAGLPGVRVDVVAIGLGLDGELSAPEWRRQVRAARAWDRRRLPRGVAEAYRSYFEWFPSEATGLACLAALGVRGRAEIRGEGVGVQVSKAQTYMYFFAAEDVLAHNRVAQALLRTRSLRAAELALAQLGLVSELAREREVVARRSPPPRRLAGGRLGGLVKRLLRYSDRAAERDIDFLTLRRVAEVLELHGRHLPQLTTRLRFEHPDRVQPPVWYTRSAQDR